MLPPNHPQANSLRKNGESTVFDMLTAQQWAQVKHRDQKRKDGSPYLNHIYHVVDYVETITAKTIAYLHDIVEDTDVTVEQVTETFGERVGRGVDALTRREDETYWQYINRLKGHETTVRLVKRADVMHNLQDCYNYRGHPKPELEGLAKRYIMTLKGLR